MQVTCNSLSLFPAPSPNLFPPTPTPCLFCSISRWRGRATSRSCVLVGGRRAGPAAGGLLPPPPYQSLKVWWGLAWVPDPTPVALPHCPRAVGQLLAAPWQGVRRTRLQR